MATSERLLVFVLRCGGVLLLFATFAIFEPVDSMARTHVWLGLGEFPASTLTDYLTRSLSALYALHGGMLLVISTDVRRYAPLVRYIGFTNLAFGVILIGIDLHAGMPTWWLLVEGPPVLGIGLVVLHLQRRLPAVD